MRRVFSVILKAKSMSKLETSVLSELQSLIIPLTEHIKDRQALLQLAVGNTPVYQLIDFSGTTDTFTIHLLTTLAAYGEISPGRQALWAFLEVIRIRVGVDQQQRIDILRPLVELLSETYHGLVPAPNTSLETIRSTEGTLPPQINNASSYVKVYRRALRERHGTLYLPRFGGVAQDRKYWELKLRKITHTEDNLIISPKIILDKNTKHFPKSGIMVIEGEPGCGKTVLLDYLVWLGGMLNGRLPILLPLYGYDNHSSVEFARSNSTLHSAICSRIEYLLSKHSSEEAVSKILNTIMSKDGIILLDGWDEVPASKRHALGEEIINMARDTRIVITTRRYQDLTALQMKGNTPYLEICELDDKTIESALQDELNYASAGNKLRHSNISRLVEHWHSRSVTVLHLSRNPQMLRLLIEFYDSGRQGDNIPLETELIKHAIAFVRKGRENHAFPQLELLPGGPVLRALGAWCWKVLSDPQRRHGHRELTASEIVPFWERRGLLKEDIYKWFEHLAANTIWFHKIGQGRLFDDPDIFQIRHPIFVSYLAAISLVARALGLDFEVDQPRDGDKTELIADVVNELSRFADSNDKGLVDNASAGQVFRFFGSLMPPPQSVRVEDVLCRLLQSDSPKVSRMAFHLVAGESQARVSTANPRIRQSSAEQIASQIRSKPRAERVSLIRHWHEEARSFRLGRDEDEAIELIRVLKGLLLTPSGKGVPKQRLTAPLTCWAEKDSEVIVRAYALVGQIRQILFFDKNKAPDEFHELLEGRLNLLCPGLPGTQPPLKGYWVDIPAGQYFIGDQQLNQNGRALPRREVIIQAPVNGQAECISTIQIARYPISVREYQEFDAEHKMGMPYDEPSRPKVFLTWFDALLYTRWRASVEQCPGIDLPSEREWEIAASNQHLEDVVIRYPWDHGPMHDVTPKDWREQIQEILQNLDSLILSSLGSSNSWEYGPWLLPLDVNGKEINADLGASLRQSPLGVWDTNGIAQWTYEAALEELNTNLGTHVYSHDRSRYVRGSGWGPGRDELYRCAYRRAFTPDFSSFLTGCRLIWRMNKSPIDPLAESSEINVSSSC